MQLTVYLHSLDVGRQSYMYASFSDEERTRRIADFCRENWDDVIGHETPAPAQNKDIINAFFCHKITIARCIYVRSDMQLIDDEELIGDPCCTVIGDSLLITQPQPK